VITFYIIVHIMSRFCTLILDNNYISSSHRRPHRQPEARTASRPPGSDNWCADNVLTHLRAG
jgi:hypothetical protein